MREIKSGDIIMRIRASSLALFFFKQEFKKDLFKSLTNICKGWVSNPKIMEYAKSGADINDGDAAEMMDILPDGLELLQITWALNKAQNQAESIQTPPFEHWLEKYGEIAVMDIFQDVTEEAMQGFFRINNKSKPPVK